MNRLFCAFFAATCSLYSYGQSNVIPDSLLSNANSVVTNYELEFTQQSPTSGDSKYFTRTIIVTNDGQGAGDFVCLTDNFRALGDFSGVIYDNEGKQVRRINRSELRSSEYSDAWISDGRYYSYQARYPKYPYTIEYRWSIKYKNGMMCYPVFAPVSSYNQSLVSAKFIVKPMAKIKVNTNVIDPDGIIMSGFDIKGDGNMIWLVGAKKAIERSPWGVRIDQRVPIVYSEPESFTYGGFAGQQDSWAALGAWQYRLFEERDKLPLDVIAKVQNVVKDATSDRQKVELLYKYLGATTRYVSIQLGIGGYQPMAASEVAKVGFGDCKALTFYLRSMLAAIGIESHYTVISTTNRDLAASYPNYQQSNHVILQVPLPGDTLWLECTAATRVPFGYIHSDIAGHAALVIDKDSSRLVRLPSYADTLNVESHKLVIDLARDGKAAMALNISSSVAQYENQAALMMASPNKQREHLIGKLSFDNIAISNIAISSTPSALPRSILSANFTGQYGNMSSGRVFATANPMRANIVISLPKTDSKIELRAGFVDCDTIIVNIPEGAKVEALPKPVDIVNDFGSFSASATSKDNQITIIHRFYMRQGKYDASKREDLRNLLSAANKAFGSRVVVKF